MYWLIYIRPIQCSTKETTKMRKRKEEDSPLSPEGKMREKTTEEENHTMKRRWEEEEMRRKHTLTEVEHTWM